MTTTRFIEMSETMSMCYRQAIRIGRNVTDIMALPCVTACLKKNDKQGHEWLQYIIDSDEEQVAEEGDWLVEDTDGRWHAFCDEVMKQI